LGVKRGSSGNPSDELSELKSLEILPPDFYLEIKALKTAVERITKKDGPRKRQALYDALFKAHRAAHQQGAEIESFYLDSRRMEDNKPPSGIRTTVRRLINSTEMYPHDKAVLKSALQLKFAVGRLEKSLLQPSPESPTPRVRIARVMCAALERYQNASADFCDSVQRFEAPPPVRGQQH
jgi:hypothetical protein